MFLKTPTSTNYLEQLLESAAEIKEFFYTLRQDLNLTEDASLKEIIEEILILKQNQDKSESKLVENSDIIIELRSRVNELLADIMEKELTANVSSFALYEFLSSIGFILDARKEFIEDAEYLTYITRALKNIKNADVMKNSHVLSEQAEQIRVLQANLNRKVEDYSKLKLQMAELFSFDCVPNLSTFDKDFESFKKELAALKLQAAKYKFLINQGVVKEVGKSISAASQFHVTYEGKQ